MRIRFLERVLNLHFTIMLFAQRLLLALGAAESLVIDALELVF